MPQRPVLRAVVRYEFRPEDAMLTWSRKHSALSYHVHPACQNIVQEPRVIDFEIVDLGFIHSDYDRIAKELDALGLRPAISSEMKCLYRTHEMYGELWGSHNLAAAGDWILEGHGRYSFCFEHDADSGWPLPLWCSGFGFQDVSKIVYARFLGVKKEA